MNTTKNTARLWRATWSHRDGYTANRYYVETNTKDIAKAKLEAIKVAKEKSRLADFPKVWSVRVYLLSEDEMQ